MSRTEPESPRGESHGAPMSVPATVYPYRAGLIGGAFGGMAMVVVASVYGLINGSVWLPVNLIGAALIRDLQGASLETLSQFNFAALIAGLALHAALSVGLGLVFALLLPTMPGPPIVWSLTVGPLLWALASLITLPIVDPVMDQYVDKPSFFVAHLAYGLVLGWWVSRTPKIRVE